MTDQICQKWFAKVRGRDFSLDNAPRSGRPVEVDSDPIKTLIENSQCSTTRAIADTLKISKSVKLLVKRKNVPFILQKTRTEFLANPILTHSVSEQFI